MPLLANLGVPMLFVQMPLLMGALPAVIFIESYLIRHWYELPWGQAVRMTAIANVLSTVLGFPLMWFVLTLAQGSLDNFLRPHGTGPWSTVFSVTVNAAWLDPGPNQAYWMVPTACLVLLVPAFFMTVLVEWPVYRRTLARHAAKMPPKRAIWRMHFFSYGFLFLAGFFLLAASIVKHHRMPGTRHAHSVNSGRPALPPAGQR